MKKIKFTLAAIALTAGIGGAFAFSPAPKSGDTAVYNTTEGTGTPVWAVISGGNGSANCTANPLRPCKGTRDALGNVTVTVYGNYPL